MNTVAIDAQTFINMMAGGAKTLHSQIKTINQLNVFPVPDGDTGSNMYRTIESGTSKIHNLQNPTLKEIAKLFCQETLLSARGNSGVILSQFFAGFCEEISKHENLTAYQLAIACDEGKKRAYKAVLNPVEGTILTVMRESAQYALDNLNENSTLEDFFNLAIKECELSLKRTKEILPALIEADVVDSGGAGFLCILKGMQAGAFNMFDDDLLLALTQDEKDDNLTDYSLFTTESVLTFGYCTECLVRIQSAKILPENLDEKAVAKQLENLGCESIVALKDGDVLKIHAHTHTPSDVLTLCQCYGEFLNVKIENMNLQHSSSTEKKKNLIPKKYAVITVANGNGIKNVFEELGADVVIDGGQTENPSIKDFLDAIEQVNAENVLIMPNNSNVILTAEQAKNLCNKENVYVIPTKSIAQGYSSLSVYNPANEDVENQISDLNIAIKSVTTVEVTNAVRDCTVNGISVKQGEYISMLDGNLIFSDKSAVNALIGALNKFEDIDDKEILTIFIGAEVTTETYNETVKKIEENFPSLEIIVHFGNQPLYCFLIGLE